MPSIPHIKEASNVWMDKVVYECAERTYHLPENQVLIQRANEAHLENGLIEATMQKESQESCSSTVGAIVGNATQMVSKQACAGSSTGNLSYLADEIARARQHIKNSLHCKDGNLEESVPNDEVLLLSQKIADLEFKNKKSDLAISSLEKHISKLENRIAVLEKVANSTQDKGQAAAKDVQPSEVTKASSTSSPVVKKDDDDDVDLFGSDDEDEENEKLKQERVQAYAAKKSKKPALIAKSNVILDVKPWDDETDMEEMERKVREIKFDGLVWGASKFVPLAYGIRKLQISCVVEDEKVSVDLLQEEIEGLEDLVQSMDIAAFNKV